MGLVASIFIAPLASIPAIDVAAYWAILATTFPIILLWPAGRPRLAADSLLPRTAIAAMVSLCIFAANGPAWNLGRGPIILPLLANLLGGGIIGLSLRLIVEALHAFASLIIAAVVPFADASTHPHSVLPQANHPAAGGLGAIFSLAMLCLFLSWGGALLLISTLAVPPHWLESLASGQMSPSAVHPLLSPMIADIARLFTAAGLLAIPTLFVLLITDLSLAILARSLPRIAGFFLGATLKPVIAIFMLAVSALFILQVVTPRLISRVQAPIAPLTQPDDATSVAR